MTKQALKGYEVAKIGSNRGAPRIWLEGMKALLAGFLPGKRFNVQKDVERNMLSLDLCDQGFRVVSKKMKGDKEIPVIDLNSAELLSVFEGFQNVRIIVQKTRIIILPLQVEIAKIERLKRLVGKLNAGESLAVGSVCHGGGVLSHAIHAGLHESGIKNRLSFANDIRPELLEHAHQHNDAWDQETISLTAPMQFLAFDSWAMEHVPRVEILEGGIACSGASVAGRGKNGAGHAESHPEVGHLVVPMLAMIAKTQPAVVLLECVTQYLNTGSMCIIRNFLRDHGYKVHETTLQSADWNAHEHRVRMCVVAVTEGLEFDFEKLIRPEPNPRPIAEILEPVPHDDPSWSRMEGLKAKELRDEQAGKGFRMQTIQASDTHCGTVTKGYNKRRSTDPVLVHPTDPDLLRLFTPAEHARLKGCPPHLVEGLATSIAHELLGQSICYAPFKAVANLIGEMFKSFVAQIEPKRLAA